jgi:two-component system NtrC family response regulator
MDDLRLILQRCIHVSELEREYREMQEGAQADVFEGVMGASPQMNGVFETIRKVAKSSAPVLILGESGTGKEMVANAIHRQSDLKGKPIVAINCNAIPENLLESELFGHEKGSFTGAHSQRKGLVEEASGGTLFLDEIGDLPAPVQVKLLRFLQEKTFQRVGGREEIKVDCRVVTATHVDLEEAMRNGTFREDLFYRLAVVKCRLPALRERGSDIMLLAKDFLKKFADQNDKQGLAFDLMGERAIQSYSWPGNVRELQNRIQRAVIMGEGNRIGVEDLELTEFADAAPAMTLKEAREQIERDLIKQAIEKHHGNISAVATELGVSRPTIYQLLDRLKIGREKL